MLFRAVSTSCDLITGCANALIYADTVIFSLCVCLFAYWTIHLKPPSLRLLTYRIVHSQYHAVAAQSVVVGRSLVRFFEFIVKAT